MRFIGLVDVDGRDVKIGCKIELMDGDMIHKAQVLENNGEYIIVPGIINHEFGDRIEEYTEGHVFQGRVIESPTPIGPSTPG